MEPLELVKSHYPLPIEPYPFQADDINEYALKSRVGLYYDVGLGKTFLSIIIGLFKLTIGEIDKVVVIMPPVLITNWSRNLSKIPGVTHVCYRGGPKARAKIDLKSPQFVLLGYQIFKSDWEYIAQEIDLHSEDRTTLVICDEAQALKSVDSQTYKTIRDFSTGQQVLLLTGTPLASPGDAYAYTKFTAPSIYRSLKVFEDLHVDERDFYKHPSKWRNIELLAENLGVNSVRRMKRDVIKDLPPVTYQTVEYDLHPKHLALYNQIANEKIAMLPEGKLDLTNATSLFYALQQIPANAEHFSGGDVDSTIYEYIDELMDELKGEKLVIYTQYVMTNRRMLEKLKAYNAVAIYGEISPKQKQAAIDRFIADPSCKVILLQYRAGGAGIDGLHEVCCNALAVELPFTAWEFHQAVGRIDRIGQRNPMTVRIALACRTICYRIYDMVLEKDALINICIRGLEDLRLAIKGQRT